MDLAETYAWIGLDADKLNGVYDGSVPRNEITRQAVRDRIDAMVREANGRVLDIGCSGGIVSVLMARKGCDVNAIDCYPDSIEKCLTLWEQEKPDTQRRLLFERGFAEDLPFENSLFDTVIMGQILEHVIHPRMALKEAMRVLKTGGKFLASVPIGYNRTVLHLRFFDQEMFHKLLDEFCKVNEMQIFNKQMLAICEKE
jgi:2-polyprenyl-6-hydroxyphenyl methylase/3-demethylubiquinone-9 3-methyltransferase